MYQSNFNNSLESVRRKYRLPALACASVELKGIVSIGFVGYRKFGRKVPISHDDKFHIGSCTKLMTATLSTLLVSEGKIGWDTTLGEVLEDFSTKMHPGYRRVTLKQLLLFQGGIPSFQNLSLVLSIYKLRGLDLQGGRQELVSRVLKSAPKFEAGTASLYSNESYVLAGAMLERVTNKTWEKLLQERLFGPLHMSSAGFGPPASPGRIDNPWGHIILPILYNLKLTIPKDPRWWADVPSAMGPAGTVHCSISDFAKYALYRLRASLGLEAQLIEEPFNNGQLAIRGFGSNIMFCAGILILPREKRAIVACTNAGANIGIPACQETFDLIGKRMNH